MMKEKIGEAYMASYAEIPEKLIEDNYLVAKKLAGHSRLFKPSDTGGLIDWLTEHRPQLNRAYGDERVQNFIDRLLSKS